MGDQVIGKGTRMKKFFSIWIALAMVLLLGAPASAQLLEDNFTGTATTALLSAGWTLNNSTTNPLVISSSGLTFTGYPGSGIGNAVNMANTGQDVYRTFAKVSSDSVYLSFMANISAALTGDYFIALAPSGSISNYYARLHVKATTGGFLVGISKNNETTGGAQYGSTIFSLSTTYLFIVKYKFVAAATAADTTNDLISVYCLPSGTSLTAEPTTPEIANYLCATKVDPTDLGVVALRQGSSTAAATLAIDGIRISTSWNALSKPWYTVNITYLGNTSTIPDTILPTSTVQLRGSMPGFTWDNNSVLMSNIGGDYWKVQVPYVVVEGNTLSGEYKFFTNVKPSITSSDGGWENNTGSGNRTFSYGPVTASLDTILPLQYANGSTSVQAQYWRPYVPATDSVAVLFRINMQSLETFNKTTTNIGLRGAFPPAYDWGTTIFLTKESNHGNAGQTGYDGTNFWSTVIKFPRTHASGNIEYKFVQLAVTDVAGTSPTWENNNRSFSFNSTMADTTLYWKWWNDQIMLPFSGSDTVIMTYRADVRKAVTESGFAYGDTLVVRSGYNSSALSVREKVMDRVGASSKYEAVDTVITKSSTPLYYQYYQTPRSGEVREIYYNFANPGASATAEKRRFMVPASANKTAQMVQDTVNSTSDEHRMPRFRNMKNLAQSVLVTYTCDVRPAIYQIKKGSKLVATNGTAWTISNSDSVILDGVWMNGPAVGGWDVGGGWGPDRRLIDTCKMWDDGTHGDVLAGDSIFSLRYAYTTSSTVGQEFKFGVYGCDNEGGFGNNHIENINDANPTATIASQFGSIDPVFFNAWDYTNGVPIITGVSGGATIPLTYRLDQNYPNPFNPTTRIDYEIKAPGRVSLKVFNVLGQVVASLVEEKKDAGKYYATFDASKLASGVYLYQFISGNYIATKKMILLK
jgi:hypothetical protein